MNQNQWQYMNKMPVTFKRKTTEELVNLNTQILNMLRLENKRDTTKEKAESALKESPYEKVFSNPDNKKYTFSTADGRDYLSLERANNAFVYLCMQMPVDTAALLVTVWFEETWQSLKKVHEKL